MTDIDRDQRRVVRTYAWVGLIVPAAIAVASLALALAWRADLPDPIATHWGPGGAADGFGSVTPILIMTPLLTLGLPALLAATTLPAIRRGRRGPVTRLVGAAALAFSVLMAVLVLGSLAIQRGLADAADAPGIGPVLLWAYGLGIGAGVVGWFVHPKQDTVRDNLAPGAAISLADGEKAVWVRTQGMRPWFATLLVVFAVGIGGMAVAMMPEEPVAGWISLGAGAFIALAAVSLTSITVTVSEAGLTVRGVAGWPRKHIALSDVASAEVAQVSGTADFGGWGWRLRPGAEGVIMRDGEAIWVKRRAGRDLAVTVDDAATGAGLLTALAARAASTGKEG